MERRNAGASTAIMDPIELGPVNPQQEVLGDFHKHAPSITGHSLTSVHSNSSANAADRNETLPSPTTASPDSIELWNKPAINIYRISATFWSFLIMGANDATYGAVIPYLEEYYNLTYVVVSLIFLSPFVGYNLAAILNNTVHMRLDSEALRFWGRCAI
ncbi:hypothetical protein LTS01_005484 [Friedmanniomyces endolithicus]|nr:hypothetical protein LTS01_005484 [Friedmanniomyces endolithicus]